MKCFRTVLVCTGAVFAFTACGSTPVANSNSANANSGPNVAVDAANLPPGLSTKPIQPSANATPGIPANTSIQTVPSNVSPAEGIPSADDLKKPQKPGATPTPGIPPPGKIIIRDEKSAANAKPPEGEKQ